MRVDPMTRQYGPKTSLAAAFCFCLPPAGQVVEYSGWQGFCASDSGLGRRMYAMVDPSDLAAAKVQTECASRATAPSETPSPPSHLQEKVWR